MNSNNNISFEKDNYIFNYRVGIIIKNNEKILIQRDKKTKHIALPGGRCEFGEISRNTAIREFKEETGINTKILRLITIVENFFTSSFNNKKYHEILFVYELKFIDKKDYNKKVINNIEDNKKEFITYEWMEINKLKENNFKPQIVIDTINCDKLTHYINNE